MQVDFNVRGQQGMNFFTGGSVNMDYELTPLTQLRWICFFETWMFLLHKILIDGLESCGLLVDYCDVFISCLDSHSDGTHSLQSIHWWANYIMLHFSESFLMKKQTHLHLSWPEGEYIFILGWTIPLRTVQEKSLLTNHVQGHAIATVTWCNSGTIAVSGDPALSDMCDQ